MERQPLDDVITVEFYMHGQEHGPVAPEFRPARGWTAALTLELVKVVAQYSEVRTRKLTVRVLPLTPLLAPALYLHDAIAECLRRTSPMSGAGPLRGFDVQEIDARMGEPPAQLVGEGT